MNLTHTNYPIFVAIEGPIGVGKSTLAQFISSKYHLHLLKEIVEENPFLSKFYDNIEEWSFQTEMYFLCNRYKQLEDIYRHHLQKGQSVVADYHIFKNMIFAQNTLNEMQFEKYRQIYNILVADLPKPNLVIYIHASLDTLLKRIALRGRPFERNIEPAYLEQLSHGYEQMMNQFIVEHPEVPVLTFNGDQLDFVASRPDLDHIYLQIEQALQLELKR